MDAVLASSEHGPDERFTDVAQLDARLDSLHAACDAEAPTLVTIDAWGHEVTLGLGAAESVVQVSGLADDGSCFVTFGDAEAQGVKTFYLHGEHDTEIPTYNLIRSDVARQIVREFVVTGRRPLTVEWEQLY